MMSSRSREDTWAQMVYDSKSVENVMKRYARILRNMMEEKLEGQKEKKLHQRVV